MMGPSAAVRNLHNRGQPQRFGAWSRAALTPLHPKSVTTWDGLQAFATTPVAAPPPRGAESRSLEKRLAYHSQFVTVRTPAIDALAKNVRTLMILGRHQAVTARPSLIVTGPAGAGKTTALGQFLGTLRQAAQASADPQTSRVVERLISTGEMVLTLLEWARQSIEQLFSDTDRSLRCPTG
ncbi:hypothetical protein [Streptomyces antimycoticus]|uniref:hypothetical protein n=1 Tax=Streptomyces antimycoticus TaxID=68175 RepID=UPI003F4D9E55